MRVIGKVLFVVFVILLYSQFVSAACVPSCDTDETCIPDPWGDYCQINNDCECGPNIGYGVCSPAECDGCQCSITPTCPGIWSQCYWGGSYCVGCISHLKDCVSGSCVTTCNDASCTLDCWEGSCGNCVRTSSCPVNYECGSVDKCDGSGSISCGICTVGEETCVD